MLASTVATQSANRSRQRTPQEICKSLLHRTTEIWERMDILEEKLQKAARPADPRRRMLLGLITQTADEAAIQSARLRSRPGKWADRLDEETIAKIEKEAWAVEMITFATLKQMKENKGKRSKTQQAEQDRQFEIADHVAPEATIGKAELEQPKCVYCDDSKRDAEGMRSFDAILVPTHCGQCGRKFDNE